MRIGKEAYSGKYERAVELHKQGIAVKDIAMQLDISYSCAYHWVKGIRKPGSGNVSAFIDYLKKSGPVPAAVAEAGFPKHNELFLIAGRRGLPVARRMLSRQLKGYGTWYFLEGQEHELESRIKDMFEKLKKAKARLAGV